MNETLAWKLAQPETAIYHVNSPTEALDLWDVLSWPTISKENYCGSYYWKWEDNVCKPALEAAGYVNITFHMGELDSFGPLGRIVRAQKDGVRVEFIYG